MNLDKAWKENTVRLYGLIGDCRATYDVLFDWIERVQATASRPSATFVWHCGDGRSLNDFAIALRLFFKSTIMTDGLPLPPATTPCSQAPVLVILKGLEAWLQHSGSHEGILVDEMLAAWFTAFAHEQHDALIVFTSTLAPSDLSTLPGYEQQVLNANPHVGQDALPWLAEHLTSEVMEARMAEFYQKAHLAHLYAQPFQHQDAYLVLNRQGAEELANAITIALAEPSQYTMQVELETSDGEGFTLHLCVTNNAATWEQLELPYTAAELQDKGDSLVKLFHAPD